MACLSINEAPVLEDVKEQLTPVLTGIEPDNAVCGDPDFTLYITGENFGDRSVIQFAGQDEPTTLSEDKTQVSTGVKPSLWVNPDVVQVYVRNGSLMSSALDFTFAEAPVADTAKKGKQHWQSQRR
jgi:hypothetical protein